MDDPNSSLRQRPLLIVDEVITPQIGNCTIFACYVEVEFATQVILNARLTRFYEREDWKRRLAETTGEALQLERGVKRVWRPAGTQQSRSEEEPAEVTVSLNKRTTVREIGRRTRLKNRDVERVIETPVEVWTEELVAGGRIEIEGFCTFSV